MVITAGSRVFIDTNILVYANLGQSPFHGYAVACLQELQDNNSNLYVNRQVLREYLAAMTRPGLLTADIPFASLEKGDRIIFSKRCEKNSVPFFAHADTVVIKGKSYRMKEQFEV